MKDATAYSPRIAEHSVHEQSELGCGVRDAQRVVFCGSRKTMLVGYQFGDKVGHWGRATEEEFFVDFEQDAFCLLEMSMRPITKRYDQFTCT